MSKESTNSYIKGIVLIFFSFVILVTIGFNLYDKPIINNEAIREFKKANIVYATLPNVFTETLESTNFYKLPISLKDLVIKENEQYQINDFINNMNILPQDISYYYTLPEMNYYKLPGTYKIQITFKDKRNNVINKETNLVIEKEEVIEKKDNTKEEKKEVVVKKEPTLTIEERILNDSKKIEGYGRIYFNNLYSIALYEPRTTEEAQYYVDNKDSGSIIKYSNISFVADHANQGFDIIKKQNIGSYVYIKKVDYMGNIVIDKYVVREKMNGYNTRRQLLTNEGIDVRNTNYPLALYTCNTADGYHVTILLLDKAN